MIDDDDMITVSFYISEADSLLFCASDEKWTKFRS